MPNQNRYLGQARVTIERSWEGFAQASLSAGIDSAIANTLDDERREQRGREHIGWAHVCRALYLAVALADA